MNKSIASTIRQVLGENVNSDTLHPGSKFKEPMHHIKDNASNVKVDTGEDLGTGPVKVGDPNPKPTDPVQKDKSRSSQKQAGEPFAVGKDNIPPKPEDGDTDETPENNPGEKFGVGKGNEPPKFAWKKGLLDTHTKEVNEEEEIDEDTLEEQLESYVQEMIEAGLTEEEIHEELDRIFESEEIDEEKDDEEKEEKKDKEVNEEEIQEESELPLEIDLTEDVNALLTGDNLSEEFKEKTKTIFEAAVKSRLVEYQAQLDEAFVQAVNEAQEEIKDQLAEEVEKYLEYVAEQWLSENEVAVESALRTELTEDFMVGLRNLFMENHMDIPEDKLDIIEELTQKNEELQKALNEEIQTNVEYANIITEGKKFEILVGVVDGLTDTESEKLRSLSEEVEFENEEDFRSKLLALRESYFPTKTIKADKTLTEAEVSDDPSRALVESIDSPVMQRYVNTLGKTLPR